MTTPPMIPIDPNNFKTPKSNNNSIVKAWGPAPPARKYRKKNADRVNEQARKKYAENPDKQKNASIKLNPRKIY